MVNPKGFMTTDRETPLLRDPIERVTDFKEIPVPLSAEKVKSQSGRCMDCGVPFCMSGCPLENRIPDFNSLVHEGHWQEAIRVLYATNNFPEFTGRICPAPCESSCVLGITDPPVTIKQMEQKIAEKSLEYLDYPTECSANATGKTVAIVGSGPSGLACAQQLRKTGHDVVVFEKGPKAGGLLTWGIPEYKLPKKLVARRILQLEEQGIKFVFNMEIGVDLSWQEVREKHDALVICIGSERPRDLDIHGRQGEGVHFAMDFLCQQSARILGTPAWGFPDILCAEGKDIIVIGGGDTGSDCIGTSLRQGARSVINFELMPKPSANRRQEDCWPRYDRSYRPSTSVIENNAMGNETYFSVATESFDRNKFGKLKSVTTIDVKWETSAAGKPEMFKVPGSKRVWDAQLVFLALGYLGPDAASLLGELPISLDARQNLRANEAEGIFVAGDCRRGQSLVVWAIAEGRNAAAKVDSFLHGDSELSGSRLSNYNY